VGQVLVGRQVGYPEHAGRDLPELVGGQAKGCSFSGTLAVVDAMQPEPKTRSTLGRTCKANRRAGQGRCRGGWVRGFGRTGWGASWGRRARRYRDWKTRRDAAARGAAVERAVSSGR
jgi:hypothetical protein